MNTQQSVRSLVQEAHSAMIAIRRDFHQHPELGFQEFRTSAIIARELNQLGFETQTGIAQTGVVGRLHGRRKGRTIALRADMDALPISEANKFDFVSQVPGRMHACGHDAHMAMALGAARVLAQLQHDLEGDVVLLFQPAEEGPGGALPMIQEGALTNVDFILGQHLMPLLEPSVIACCEGPIMAAADEFSLSIFGRGGHGAYPHEANDAIVVAAQVVTALQQIVARQVDPFDPVVLSIGTIHGGYNYNVIADKVTLSGTVRTLRESLRDEMPKRILQVSESVAAAFGARIQLDYRKHYPPVINPPEGTRFLHGLAEDIVGASLVRTCRPSMAGEDFAYYLQKIPGCFYFLGCKHPDPVDRNYNLHHPAFDLDEQCLVTGARLYVEGAIRFLNGQSA